MDVREALYTTRTMRRVKPDPIPLSVQERIMDAAVRAPNGGNLQKWRFILVDSPEVKAVLGPLYRDAVARGLQGYYGDAAAIATSTPDSEEGVLARRMVRSANWLADNFEQVPLFLFALIPATKSVGSVFPAVWSAMLAARAEGVGASLTTMLGVGHGLETLAALGVPFEENWINACCVSFGYPTGRWAVARREPPQSVTYRNRWLAPSGFHGTGPLWPDGAPAAAIEPDPAGAP
ncbi:nitroreductase family protein [Frankia sp. QA3]|uniref:nitroreductase family protein n=1 Tax=Frankia sp. QA3 TaxID=710111 RepID=UPI000269BFDA|nr:nitroreductase family protein [Frankia sp. QA3]EIV92450.1 nitroreductase [Frankia sp. QA3]